MKKYIIPGFFILMLGLTLTVIYSFRVVTMPEQEVEFRKDRDKLSDTEVSELNKGKRFEKVIPFAQDGKSNYLYNELKITRTKNGFGWETKIDTLKTYIIEEDCGC